MTHKSAATMGNEANVKAGKSTTSNPKVPPIKIVLSSNQNSAVVNICNQQQGESHPEVETKIDSSGHSSDRDAINPDAKESQSTKTQKRTSQASHAHNVLDMDRYYDQLGSMSTSSTSDCSTSTSPNSESDSTASVSTIISDDQQQVKSKVESKDDAAPAKREKESRAELKNASANNDSKTTSTSRRSQDNSADSGQNDTATSCAREQMNANQRITRSSQRAAQQNRADLNNDLNSEDQNMPENQEKRKYIQESP